MFSGLGDLPGGVFFSLAADVSRDGSVAVGRSSSANSAPFNNDEAFRWPRADGLEGIGDLPQGSFISVDGSVIVGWGMSSSDSEAFRWAAATGLVGLGDLPGFSSSASDVSRDGSVVVGRSESAVGHEAFLWNEANGMRSLKEVLEGDFGLDLAGWTLAGATAISDDGLTIVGWSVNPDDFEEAWIAQIPEPHTALLLGFSLASPGWIRRGNARAGRFVGFRRT